jgi:hypothetical protein
MTARTRRPIIVGRTLTAAPKDDNRPAVVAAGGIPVGRRIPGISWVLDLIECAIWSGRDADAAALGVQVHRVGRWGFGRSYRYSSGVADLAAYRRQVAAVLATGRQVAPVVSIAAYASPSCEPLRPARGSRVLHVVEEVSS